MAKIKTDNTIFWSYVRKQTKTKSVVPKLQMSNGELSSTCQETADSLNDYFASVFIVEDRDNIPTFEDREFTQSIDIINISEELAEEAIERTLPSHKRRTKFIFESYNTQKTS